MEEHACFYDPNFLQAQPLTTENIISYFATSQFYDRNCLNEILKMQSQFAAIDIGHHLTHTIGFYYILEHHSENLFVIAKKEFNGADTQTLSVYYCLFGCIYCAPTAKSISDCHITEIMWHLNRALDLHEEERSIEWSAGLNAAPQIESKSDEHAYLKEVADALYDYEKYRS